MPTETKTTPREITENEAYTASMLLQVHGASTDGFYKDVCLVCKALIHSYYDQQDAKCQNQ